VRLRTRPRLQQPVRVSASYQGIGRAAA
jgi:hypothetical protein